MYRSLLVFHRWLALVTSLFLIVIAVSAAGTVLEGPVAQANVTHLPATGTPLSLDTLAARAVASVRPVSSLGDASVVPAAAQSKPASILLILLGETPDVPVGFRIGESFGNGKTVEVNPYTGAILPDDHAGPTRMERWVRKAHEMHVSLLAGRGGGVVVGYVTLATFILALTGLILWWKDRIWRVRMGASWKRVVFDLHHVLGLVASVVIVIMTGTGIWMTWQSKITPLVLELDGTPTAQGQPKVAPTPPDAVPIALDSVVRLAHSVVPGAPVMNLQFQKGLAIAQLKYPEDRTPAGRSRVFMDRYRGTVLRYVNTRTAEPGTKLLTMQRSLHTGDVLGAPTQIIWFLSALVLATQAVTGVLMWWNGRPARRAAKARVAASREGELQAV